MKGGYRQYCLHTNTTTRLMHDVNNNEITDHQSLFASNPEADSARRMT